MEQQIDDAVETYREFAGFPVVSNATISNKDTPGHIHVNSHWTQRDLERSVKVKFSRNYFVQLDNVVSSPPADTSTEVWNQESHSGHFRAIVRKVKDKTEEKQYLEVWDQTRKVQNIDVSSLKQHGQIYDDAQFGCLEWSYSETHLLYVAEKKRPKTGSYFVKQSSEESRESTKEEETVKGDEFVLHEDWGEQLVKKSHPVICVLDIETGVVSTIDNLPDDVSPGQAIWCSEDTGIVCVGWWHVPYRLGLVYCPIRRSALFYIDLKTSACSVIGPRDRAVRFPRFSPDHSKLIYLDNSVGGAHQQCNRLMMCDWSNKGIVPVLEVVHTPKEGEFPGLFVGSNQSVPRCWAADSRRILLPSFWRSKRELVLVDVMTGHVTRLTDDPAVGSWLLLDVHNDLILAACSSPNQPNYLVIGHLPEAGKESSIKWTRLDRDTPRLENIAWRIFTIRPTPERTHSKFSSLDYECYVLEPKPTDEKRKPPLVVYIHGGPHSLSPTEFMLYLAALSTCGFAVLTVNYRGSLGFGQDSIDSLPGNIGTQDVQDVQAAVEHALQTGIGDRERVCVIGGSHGGFLTAHLIGQYPDFYKAAVTRNPVINVASQLGVTDIPDWCVFEGGEPFDTTTTPSPELYTELWKRSPIRYVDQMKTPLMLMLGECDRRVPPAQGHELRKALQARDIPVRMLVYPEDQHPLNKVHTEADAFVNIVRWFLTYITPKSSSS